MMLRRNIAGIVAVLVPTVALGTGFTDIDPPASKDSVDVVLHGNFRARGEGLDNLDLDRGLTPSGQPLYPVPLGDPTAQWLTGGNMRLRTDVAIVAPGGGFAVKVRADLLDNAALGGAPIGPPSSSTAQAPANVLAIKRAYGEAYTPFGVVSAGRMGNQWGLGMLANGGDCADCDSGDAADRLMFATPLAGHIWALAYDFSAAGRTVTRPVGTRVIDVEPSSQVRSLTFAVTKWDSPRAIDRRTRAGKWTLDYGLFISHRDQDTDIPAQYLAAGTPIDGAQVVPRQFSATAFDVWARFIHPDFRAEVELASFVGRIGESSLVPGVLLRDPVDMLQFGGALETEYGSIDAPLKFGIDAGFASGDPAPGFGAFPKAGSAAPQQGDLDGMQARFPSDRRIDNFRFASDYRIDKILFREIIGTVTDAIYVRPHVRYTLWKASSGTLQASVAAVGAFALAASSTPSGQSPLGVEIDPTLSWSHVDGFSATLDYAAFVPFVAFDNPANGQTAKPAQLIRLRLAYAF